MKQVFILGAYGQNNIGDEALLEVFISQFKDYKLLINSAQPEITAARYKLKVIPTHFTWNLSRTKALLTSDTIVFGGGSLLKEIEGSYLRRLLYCLRILTLLLISKLLGHHTVMLGVGIGPLKGRLFKILSRLSARLVDVICVRDTASQLLLRAIGVSRNVYVTADPVFMLQRTFKPVKDLITNGDEAPIVAVVPRYSLSEAQLQKLAEGCDHLVEKYGAHIWIVPFQTGFLPRFDDVASSATLQSLMQHPERAEIKTTATPEEVLHLLKQTDLVLSTRLHGLIFSTILAVPCVAINYEVKVASFMAEIGLEENTISLLELEQARLVPVLDTAWEKREATAEKLKIRAEELEEAAARNFELAQEQKVASNSAKFLKGGALLFVSITIVNAGNYLFNLVLGRWLGPAAFAELSLIITLALVMTFASSTLQTVAAKFSAIYSVDNNLAQLWGLRRWLQKVAWGIGLALMGLIVVFSAELAKFFNASSPWPFILLAIALPFCFSQGVDRGILQGKTRFGLLALSYQAEMWVRLLVAVVLVAFGLSVNGAVGALLLSFLASWFVVGKVRKQLPDKGQFDKAARSKALHFAIPVSGGLVGQVLLNNSDIIIVNHFFLSHDAGQYAAVALIGRIVFFATWSVVTTLFPIVAQLQQQGKPHRHLLGYSLALVGSISVFIVGATYIAPELVMRLLFGEAYVQSAPLLWLYALATAFYALANVIINYRLSAGNGLGSWFAAMAGVAQVVGLCLWHDSLQQVVFVQVLIMAGLFGLLLIWDSLLVMRRVVVRNAL